MVAFATAMGLAAFQVLPAEVTVNAYPPGWIEANTNSPLDEVSEEYSRPPVRARRVTVAWDTTCPAGSRRTPFQLLAAAERADRVRRKIATMRYLERDLSVEISTVGNYTRVRYAARTNDAPA